MKVMARRLCQLNRPVAKLTEAARILKQRLGFALRLDQSAGRFRISARARNRLESAAFLVT